MKKLIAGVSLIAILAGCIFLGDDSSTAKYAGDRNGGLIAGDRNGGLIAGDRNGGLIA